MKRKISILSLFLSLIMIIGMFPTAVKADTYAVVSIAKDISEAEKEEAYKFFGVDKNSVNEIITNNADERKALLGIVPEVQIGTVTKSSAYVLPTSSGGIKVETNNLTWVSDSMITNTLITLGITNAEVKAFAPFPVSGTGALTGIMKGFENSKDSEVEISEEKKEVANEELVMTGQLGEKIGKDEASVVVNDIKTQVIKDSPKTDIEIGNIVTNVVNNYNINVSPEDKAKIVSVMSKINDLDLDYKELKGTLKENKENIMTTLEEVGSEIKEAGWFRKALTGIKSFGRWIGEGFSKLSDYIAGWFSDEESNEIKEKDGVKYDSDGNIVTDGNLFIPDETRTPEEIKQQELESQEQETDSNENSVNGTLNKVE